MLQATKASGTQDGIECVACPAGTRANHRNTQYSCELCPAGEYDANPGEHIGVYGCHQCPAGNNILFCFPLKSLYFFLNKDAFSKQISFTRAPTREFPTSVSLPAQKRLLAWEKN